MIHIEYINEAGQKLAQLIEKEKLSFSGEAVIFIGALGICVRKIQELIHDKYKDPAVVCVDSLGKYAIPVLSGHVGGANELARQIAMVIGGEPIITTQSDNEGLWALDTLARNNGWGLEKLSRQEMNQVIALFVNKERTALVIEQEDEGTRQLVSTCPEHVTIFHCYQDYLQSEKSDFRLLILVSPHIYAEKRKPSIQYFPRCLHLGVGCQKDVPAEAASQLLGEIQSAGYAQESIASIGSIELKKDEEMLARLSELMPWARTQIFPADELEKIEIPHPNEKVFEVTGCHGVAESSALVCAERGLLVVEKQKGCLVTEETTDYYTFALAQDGQVEKKGHVEIVGAGPGDPDLVSVRGRKWLEKADLILYAGSLVPRELTYCAKKGATVRSSADLDLEEQFELMKKFYDQGKLVVRLHTGDPCIYGAIQEQMAFFDEHGMDYHITPGISSFLAAAAELRSQFTIPEKCQTIILTRGEGRTPMPDKEQLNLLASHQSTMCIFLSASIAEKVQQQLLDGGYPPETPVAACYKLTWKDQRIYRGQLKDLAKIIIDNHLTLTTMIVVGKAIDNRHGLSKLYDKNFTHLFRKGK